MKNFKYPGSEFRGMPFWSLNDQLDPDEMIRQVEEFHRAGMGGFFLHSRIGLITEYLGAEWMDALLAAIKKAGELGMKAWLYDEDKWPSGCAGGIVPLQNPEFRGQYLGRVRNADLPEQAKLIFSDKNWNYFTATIPLGAPEFNGTCYTDLMNPDAVKAYINSTHEKYIKAFGQYFGNIIPGIFTDEPIMRMRQNWLPDGFDYLPYSPCLLDRYQRIYGESPFLYLPELFEDIENSEKYRYRYWKTATIQFVEAFTKQIGEWCEQNSLKLTGHFMYEDSVEDQTRWIGKAMAHYEYMQLPGIDHLAMNIDNIITAKQCSSVAHQQGKQETLSEMFGCAGQNMTFEDRQWIAGWHGVMGINFVCQHLSLYSLRGCRKRDYPPTFSWHQPYWKDNAIIEDWQARLSYLLRAGTPHADFLVIHPAESGWCLQKGNETNQKMQEIDEHIKSICQELFHSHRDFDFGDEDYLARHATIESNRFCVGEMSYRAVIIPSMFTMRQSTLNLLENFSKAGGNLISCSTMPELIDGEYSAAAIQLLSTIIAFNISDIEALGKVLNKTCPPEVKITGQHSENVFVRRQKMAAGELLILFNTSRTDSALIDLPQACIEFNLENGEEIFIQETPLSLAPAQTRVLLLNRAEKSTLKPAQPINRSTSSLNGSWQIAVHDLNSLPLDFTQWSIDNGATWHAAEPVIVLKTRLDNEKFSGPLKLRYFFTNRADCLDNIFLAAEIGNNDLLLINGQQTAIGSGAFLDKCLRKTDISKQLIVGLNIIELQLNYSYADATSYQEPAKRYGTELETLFIIGDFGVYGTAVDSAELPKQVSHDIWPDNLPERRVIRLANLYIAEKKTCSEDGELTLNGLPFYAGTASLTTEFVLGKTDSCQLMLEYLDAIIGRVLVNGIPVTEVLSRRPFELDITNLVKLGKNRLTIELTNSLRNLLGPHHSTMGELAGVGPYSFTCRDFKPGEFAPEPNWSLPEKRRRQKSWTDDYFVVRFGLNSGIKIC